MNRMQEQVTEFHRAIGATIGESPAIRDKDFRWSLIDEEVNRELKKALDDGDLVEAADAIMDSIYVLIGTAVAMGIDVETLFDEVHRTNMAKLDGGYFDENKKFIKPPGWKPPRIAELIARMRGEGHASSEQEGTA